MSAFRVGQRVRVRWTYRSCGYVGREGVIVEGPAEYWDEEKEELYTGYTLDFDPDFGPTADQLEPLIKPDNEATTWDEMGFHPSKFLRVLEGEKT